MADIHTNQPFGDTELLEALRQGDEQAYAQLVTQQGPRMLAVAKRILRDEHEANDALQEAMISAIRNIQKFDGRSQLSTWLHRIVVNAALMRLRKRKRLDEVSIDTTQPTYDHTGHRENPTGPWKDTPDSEVEQDERKSLVHEAIAKLPETHREVLLLRDIEQLDTDQTAEALGIQPGAVKTRLHRARQALRELLEPYMQEGAAL